jgi:hypothetical protein
MRQDGSVEDRIREAFSDLELGLPIEAVISTAGARDRLRRRLMGLAAAGMAGAIFLVIALPLGSAPAYGWTPETSSPDPQVVAGIRGWCTPPGDTGLGPLPPTVLVDQRGTAAAAYFGDESRAWVCFVHFDGANWTTDGTAGSGGPLDPFLPPVSLDSVMAWRGLIDVTGVRGRVSEAVVSVRVIRADGEELEASVQDGIYLAWWPTGDTVRSVVAMDGAGKVVGRCVPDSCR